MDCESPYLVLLQLCCIAGRFRNGGSYVHFSAVTLGILARVPEDSSELHGIWKPDQQTSKYLWHSLLRGVTSVFRATEKL